MATNKRAHAESDAHAKVNSLSALTEMQATSSKEGCQHHIMYYWYSADDVIGKGAYGMVRRAYDVRNCQWYSASPQDSMDGSATDSTDSLSLPNSQLTKSYVLSDTHLQSAKTPLAASPAAADTTKVKVTSARNGNASAHVEESGATNGTLGARRDVSGSRHYDAAHSGTEQSTSCSGSSNNSSSSSNARDAFSLAGARVVALKTIHSQHKDGGLTQATLREIMVLQEASRRVAAVDERVQQRSQQGFFGLRCTDHVCPTTSAASIAVQSGSQIPPAFSLASLSPLPANSFVDSCALSTRGSANLCTTSLVNTAANEDNMMTGKLEEDEYNALSVFGADKAASQPELCHLPDPFSEAIALGQEHIIELHDVMVDTANSCVHIALEYCDGGDLAHFMHRVPSRRIEDAAVYRRWMRELVQALAFLHSRHISHRDVKPQNVMLKRRDTAGDGSPLSADVVTAGLTESDSEVAVAPPVPEAYTLKLGDFGLSRVEDIPVKKYVHEAVTLWYRSPDVLLGNNNFGYSADAWSLGCIMLEIATGVPPFCGSDETTQLQRIFHRLGSPTADNFPSAEHYAHSGQFGAVLRPRRKSSSACGSTAATRGRTKAGRKEAGRHSAATRGRGGSSSGPEPAGGAQTRRASDTGRTTVGETPPQPLPQQPPPLCPAPARCRANSRRSVHVQVRRTVSALRNYLKARHGLEVLGDDGLDLVARLLLYEPTWRLSVCEALRHRFFQAGQPSPPRVRRTSLISTSRRELVAPCGAAALTTFNVAGGGNVDRVDENWDAERAEGEASFVTALRAENEPSGQSLATTHMPLLSFPQWQHGEQAGRVGDGAQEKQMREGDEHVAGPEAQRSQQAIQPTDPMKWPSRRSSIQPPAQHQQQGAALLSASASVQPIVHAESYGDSSGNSNTTTKTATTRKPLPTIDHDSLQHQLRHMLGDTLTDMQTKLKNTLPPIKHTRRAVNVERR